MTKINDEISEKRLEKKLEEKFETTGQISEEADGTAQSLKYSESGIHTDILKAVREMGFEVMTPIQEQAIPVLLDGKDMIGQAQTGTGKTAAFAIPMIQGVNPEIHKPQGIILCPTRELAMQAAEEIRKLAKYMQGIKVLPVYGGQDIGRQIKALSQGVQIIVGTPGRVMDHLRRHTIKTSHIKMIVLDEADEMLNMGFREDIETVLEDMPEEHQMALFSATMPQAILDITGTYQKDAVYVKVTPKEVTVAAIKQYYYRVAKKDKTEALCRLIDYYQPSRSLIFCNTKRMVDEITIRLKEKGYEAEGLHGDLSQNQRDTVMNLFRNGRCEILIATDVAARGIDVSGVDAVFNYDVPEDIEYYVHRIGRTGRAGKTGRSFTLISGREIFKIRNIERVCHTTIKERKIPTPADITKVKAGKLFIEAIEVMESKDLTEMKRRIQQSAEENDYDVLDLAAAFMQMSMGDEPEEIAEEKPYPEKSRRDRDRRGRRDRREDERRDGARRDRRNSERRDAGRRDKRDGGRREADRRDRKSGERNMDRRETERRDRDKRDFKKGKTEKREKGGIYAFEKFLSKKK
ncbi:DEAD-box ATP-dependent RNA helicase CshA [Lachnospiraceae bacterium]|nr:DEAD-box ATP-dependent RNA helicase CshA [Lachnospiraceae bacterium]